jgi:hypothetical protein
VIQGSREESGETSSEEKSLDIEVRIQELTDYCCDDDSLETLEARPKVSWQI